MAYPYRIRALTLHLSRGLLENEGVVEDKMYRLLEARDLVESGLGIEVDSVRVTLPNTGDTEFFEILEVVARVKPEEVLVSMGNIGSSSSRLKEAVGEAVSSNLYIGILLEEPTWDASRRISKLIHDIAEEDLGSTTRVGVNVLGEPIYTPYYPLSYSPGDRVSLTASLTYPNYLREAYQKGGVKGLGEAVENAGLTALKALGEATKSLEAGLGGVDLSVAPWMEESSLGLAEAVAGVRMPKPGFAMGVRVVNEVLESVASKIGLAVGFNELQLPVAEDLKLKARVSEGEITARDLARLSGVCLAGLDLVAVPGDVDGVAGLILEVAAYSRAKGRVLGVRVIPVEGAQPGDAVTLPRFGETPVIPI
jgi:hypothetical protein